MKTMRTGCIWRDFDCQFLCGNFMYQLMSNIIHLHGTMENSFNIIGEKRKKKINKVR